VASNPGAALLAALSVEVGTDLSKLFKGLREAESAVNRFNQSSSRRTTGGGIDQTASSAEKAQRTIDMLRRTIDRTGASARDLADKAAAGGRGVDRLGGSSDRTRTKLEEMRRAAERFGSSAIDAGNKTERASRQMDNSFASIRRTLIASASLIAGAFGVNRLKEMADDYVTFTNRIRSAGVEGERLENTQERLFGLAQRYGVQLTGLGTLYGRIVQAQRELGASDRDVMRAVEGTAASLRLYGATQQEARGALLQFTQLLGGTRVQMQEYNSINDGARPILQAVANGIDRMGGSISKLRSEIMSEQGLSVPEFFQGYLRGIGDIERQAQNLPFTLSQSFEVLSNALTRYTGETDKAWGISQFFGAAIRGIGENLDTIMPALSAIVLIIGARLVGALGASALGWIRNTAVVAAQTLATTNLARAQIGLNVIMGQTGVSSLAAAAGVSRLSLIMSTASAGASRLGSSLLAAFGGPVGLAILAIAGAVYAFSQAKNQAREATENFERVMRSTSAAIAEGNRLLGDASQRATAAQQATQQLNSATQSGTVFMNRFAGATGDAANALYQQALQARATRVELLRLQAVEARNAAQQQRGIAQGIQGSQAVPGVPLSLFTNLDEQATANAAELESRAATLEDQAGRLERTRPEDWVSPNQATQGRNLPAEMQQAREQLAATTNPDAQRQLLRRIKVIDRAQSLIRNERVPFDLAIAQAEAENPPRAGPVTDAQRDQRRQERRERRRINTREEAIGIAIRQARQLGFEPSENQQAGGVQGNHPGMGNEAHGRFATDINVGSGNVEADNPEQRARFDALALMYQRQGLEVVWNGRFYPAGGQGPTRRAAGHRNHMHVQAPQSVVGQLEPENADAQDALGNALQDEALAASQRQQNFVQGQQQANSDILQARTALASDLTAQAELERQAVNQRRDERKLEIERQYATGDIEEAHAQQLDSLNEQARTLELEGVALQHRQRVAEQTASRAQQRFEISEETLEIERDLARTASQRREVERRILIAQETYERQRLQAIIDNPDTSPFDRQMAQLQQGQLGERFGGRRRQLNRDAREELLAMGPEDSRSAHQAQLAEIERQREERLDLVREALEQRLILEEEAARRRVEIEKDAQRQVAELEAAKWQTAIEGARTATGAVLDVLREYAGEQSAIYKAIFIADKAFAIAQAILNIQVGIARAASLPFPANIPAIASVIAATASIVSNIMSIGAQFDVGGWTGGQRGKPAGTVHGEEFVVRAGPAARHRPMLEAINSGRDPTSAIRASAGQGGFGPSAGRGRVLVKQMPGVAIEYRESITTGDVELIAKRSVEKHAPGVVAGELDRPNSRVRKSLQRSTTARGRKS
jgi:tape measure domain-containing protein